MGNQLLLVGTAGLFVYHLFRVVGFYGVFNDNLRKTLLEEKSAIFTFDDVTTYNIGWLSVISSVCFLLQVAIQTSIIVVGNSVKRITPVADCAHWQFFLFIPMAICNLIVVLNGLMVSSNLSYTDPVVVLGFSQNWPAISRGLFPLMIFYRFNSISLLLDAATNFFGKKPV